MDLLLNTLIQGILIGGLYAMFATGLSLIFGVMKLVNLAHGDFTVLAAYVALAATQLLGVNPFLALVFVIPIMGIIGYVLQRGVFNRTLGNDVMPPLLVSFGISVILQNTLLALFSGNDRRLLAGQIEIASISLNDQIRIGALPALQFLLAVLAIGGLQFLLYKTPIGRAFRAVSDDNEVSQLMGVNNRHVFGLAMALSLAIVSLAGVLLAIRSNFTPSAGPSLLIFGFEAVIIGGLASFWGTLAGGVILGVVQAFAAVVDPGLQVLAGHLAFLLILAIRPEGLWRRAV